MKILILGAFNKGALEHYYVRGLQKAGVDCVTYDIAEDYYTALGQSVINRIVNKLHADYFFRKINQKLLGFAKGKQFDVILIFKGLTLFQATIEGLKPHTRLLCCYNPDHPFKFFSPGSGNHHILESIGSYHIYFTYASRISRQLKEEWKVESYTIPFGYDDADVTNYTSGHSAFKNKLLFIGAWDYERADWLSRIENTGLEIYGDSKWSGSKAPAHIRTAFQGKPLYDNEYREAIQNASGIINLMRRQNIEEQSHNMRTFEVPGYGGVLVSNRTEEQLAFFEEDKEAVFFSDADELNDKLRYLAGHHSIVEKIKTSARIRSEKSKYGYSWRSEELVRILRGHL